MALRAHSSYSRHFLEKKRLLLDSNILIDISKKYRDNHVLNELESFGYTIVFCSPSIVEVGLGPQGVVGSSEYELAVKIYNLAMENSFDSISLLKSVSVEKPPPKRFVYNPSPNEWLATKRCLMNIIERRKPESKNYMRLFIDSIIYTCTWNCRAAIVTENIQDFMALNELQDKPKTKSGEDRFVPIYTLEDVYASVQKDIIFPDNVKKKSLSFKKCIR